MKILNKKFNSTRASKITFWAAWGVSVWLMTGCASQSFEERYTDALIRNQRLKAAYIANGGDKNDAEIRFKPQSPERFLANLQEIEERNEYYRQKAMQHFKAASEELYNNPFLGGRR